MTSTQNKLYDVRFASWTTFAVTIEANSSTEAIAKAEAIYDLEGEHGFFESGGGTEPFMAFQLPPRTQGGQP